MDTAAFTQEMEAQRQRSKDSREEVDLTASASLVGVDLEGHKIQYQADCYVFSMRPLTQPIWNKILPVSSTAPG